MRDSALNAAPADQTAEAEAPRLNRRQAAKVLTRQKVLDAARALFAERGYDAATIRDIAKGAGMSTGAVFANFQDKAELFEAVLTEDLARLADVMRQGAPKDGPTQVRLVEALTAAYHSSQEQLPLMQAIMARSWFQPAEAEARSRPVVRALLAVVGDILQAGVRSGELRQDTDIKLMCDLIFDAFLSNYRHAAYEGWSVEQQSKRLDRQVQVILAGALAR